MNSHEDLYEILQVHHFAESEVIEAAYKRLLRMYHPDVNRTSEAHNITVRLNRAYETLRDPVRRAAYDRSLRSSGYSERGRQHYQTRSQDDICEDSGSRPEYESSDFRGRSRPKWSANKSEPRTPEEWAEHIEYATREAERGNLEPLDWNSARPSAQVLTRQLFTAVNRGDSRRVRSLIDRGAEINARNVAGVSPLHMAILEDDTGIADILLSMEADPNIREGVNQLTPLHYAVGNGNTELVISLIASGADPNVTDAVALSTPLHVAASKGLAKIALSLILGGGSVDPIDGRGRAPIDLALANGHTRTAAAILDVEDYKKGQAEKEVGRRVHRLFQAVRGGDKAEVLDLIGEGVDVNAISGNSAFTCLHWAA